MARAGVPAYLGGIGLMLEVAHVCPRCGKQLSTAPSAASRHLAGNGCRPTVFAALPEPEPRAEEDDLPSFSAERRIHDFELPVPGMASVAVSRRGEEIPPVQPGTRSFAVAWLRPPDLLEVP
jgi:hypothetical protein